MGRHCETARGSATVLGNDIDNDFGASFSNDFRQTWRVLNRSFDYRPNETMSHKD